MSRPSDHAQAASPALPALTIQQGAELRSLVGELLALHERMLVLNHEHRAAISRADAKALEACVAAQSASATRLVELDGRRATLVRSVLAGPTPIRGAPVTQSTLAPGQVTLTMLAARMGGAGGGGGGGGGLGEQIDRLRQVMTRCAQQQQTIAMASRAMLGHVRAIVEQVGRSLSQTGTYARPGSAPAALAHHATAPSLASVVDLTT
jgi:hypothetical protein